MLIDAHCHLDFEALAVQRAEVLARAREAGIGLFLSAGTTRSDFPSLLKITQENADVYCSCGVHPHEADKPEEKITLEELIALTADPKVVGIGETGLDYFYDHAPRAAQEENFRIHIRACIATGLPLIIHTRDAEEDTLRILRQEREGHEDHLRGVFHCYSSNRALAQAGLAMGFYFSFSGMLTFKKSEEIRAIAKDVPLDKILVETDAPYLAPEPYRGKICEPAYVRHTATRLAEVKGLPFEDLAHATTENFFRLFDKTPRIAGY